MRKESSASDFISRQGRTTSTLSMDHTYVIVELCMLEHARATCVREVCVWYTVTDTRSRASAATLHDGTHCMHMPWAWPPYYMARIVVVVREGEIRHTYVYSSATRTKVVVLGLE